MSILIILANSIVFIMCQNLNILFHFLCFWTLCKLSYYPWFVSPPVLCFWDSSVLMHRAVIYSFSLLYSIPFYTYFTIYPFSFERHLHYFCFFANINDTTTKSCTCFLVHVCKSFFRVYISRRETVVSQDTRTFDFTKWCQAVFQSNCTNLQSHQ